MLPGEALAHDSDSRGRGDLLCRTYNVTLRANQVSSRCSSQNSCKLVAECSLCLGRAHEIVRGKSKRGWHEGARSGPAARASDGFRVIDCWNPLALSDSEHSQRPESTPVGQTTFCELLRC